MLESEVFRLVRRTMPRILIGLFVLIVLGLYFLLLTAVQASDEQAATTASVEDLKEMISLREVHALGMDLVFQIGAIMVVILAASHIANEYSWGTIRTLLPRTAGRSAFLAAKLVTLILFVILVTLIGFFTALGSSALVTSIGDLEGGLGEDFVTRSLTSCARVAFVMLPYMALAFLVALWSRSTAAGIGIGLAVLFVEGTITPLIATADALAWLDDALPSGNAAAVLNANATGPDPDAPSAWRGAAVLFAYLAAFTGLSFWRFNNRDITTA